MTIHHTYTPTTSITCKHNDGRLTTTDTTTLRTYNHTATPTLALPTEKPTGQYSTLHIPIIVFSYDFEHRTIRNTLTGFEHVLNTSPKSRDTFLANQTTLTNQDWAFNTDATIFVSTTHDVFTTQLQGV